MLTLTIDGVDRTAWLARGYSLDIEKVLSTETMHLAILDLDSTAGAYRPTVGEDIVLVRDDGSGESGDGMELLFGGEIANVIDEPIIDDLGTVTRIRCRDRMVLADQVFLPPQTYDKAPVREVFTPIVETYLGPKGVEVISDPSGGPEIPELRIEDPVTSVRQTLDRITLQCGWPWRINGERKAGIIEPGELMGPATLADDGQSVLTDPPLRWEKQILTGATRVFVQTAIPEFGPGPVEYTEDITPASGTGVVPVHVLPTEIQGSTSAEAASLETTLALTGLPVNASIRIGARLAIDWHTQVYTLTSATTTNADGEATVSLDLGVERDVPEGHPVTFLPGGFVELSLDGVVTPMDGSPYVWDPVENAIVYPAGDLGGVEVRYRTWIMHPTFVREWDGIAQQSVGWFDYEFVVDQRVTEEEGHTTLDGARAFAQAELERRLTPPKKVTCTTQIPGHYPLLMVPMNFPDRLVVGNYLVTETRIRHTNIDENNEVIGNHFTQPLFYELVLWEGDSLGESWIQYFRGKNPAQGIRWGSAPPLSCGEIPETVILAEDFSAGASAAFANNERWEVPPDSADSNYPGLYITEALGVNTGGGPNGENYLTLHGDADADDWVVAAAVWRDLGDQDFGPGLLMNNFDASRGLLRFDLRFTEGSLDHSYYHLIYQVVGTEGYANLLAAFSTYVFPQTPADIADLNFELHYGIGAGGSVVETTASTVVSKATLLAEGWQTWRVCWQCGTYLYDGSDFTVQNDGWLRVYRGGALMFNLTGIALTISDGEYQNYGNDRANHVRQVALGWNGVAGDVANVLLRCDGATSDTAPSITQTATKIGADGDSTNAVALDSPITVEAGDTIIVGVSVYNYALATPGTVSDGTNSYALVAEHGDDVTNQSGVRVYKATALASGSITPAYTPAVTEWVSIGVVHVGGTTTVHQSATALVGDASPGPFGVVLPATTVPNCLILAFLSNDDGDKTVTAHTGNTLEYLEDPGNDQATVSCVSKRGLSPAVYTPLWDAAVGGWQYHVVGLALARA